MNQLDIIAAQQAATYLTGPYAAIRAGGQVLWTSDGSNAGTQALRGSSSVQFLVQNGESMFFTADDGNGYGIWTSDGTSAGTVPIADRLESLFPSAGTPQPDRIAAAGGED